MPVAEENKVKMGIHPDDPLFHFLVYQELYPLWKIMNIS